MSVCHLKILHLGLLVQTSFLGNIFNPTHLGIAGPASYIQLCWSINDQASMDKLQRYARLGASSILSMMCVSLLIGGEPIRQECSIKGLLWILAKFSSQFKITLLRSNSSLNKVPSKVLNKINKHSLRDVCFSSNRWELIRQECSIKDLRWSWLNFLHNSRLCCSNSGLNKVPSLGGGGGHSLVYFAYTCDNDLLKEGLTYEKGL